MVNFNCAEAGLKSKWGRVFPAVQWRYKIQSNCIVPCRATSPINLLPRDRHDTHRYTGTHTVADRTDYIAR